MKKSQSDDKNGSIRKKVFAGVVGLGVIAVIVLMNSGRSSGDNTAEDINEEDVELVGEINADEEETRDVGDRSETDSESNDVNEENSGSSAVLFEDMSDEEFEEYAKKTGVETVVKSSGGNGGVSIGVTPYDLGDTIEIGPLEVVVNSAERTKDDDGNEVVFINYHLTNTSADVVNWSTAISTYVEQNEEELTELVENEFADTKSGETTKNIQEVYQINNDGEVMLELTELISDTYERALVIFNVPSE